jgi:replicative DNA helicase
VQHVFEAELAVLAGMLFDGEAISTARNILTPADFFKPNNAEIFSAMISLFEQSVPVDVITLTSELEKRTTLEKVGGQSYIVELAATYYTSANTKYHAIEVKRHSENRRIKAVLTDLLQKPESVTVNDLQKAAQEAAAGQYIHECVDKARQALENFKKNLRAEKPRISTGFSLLDGLTGGLRIPSVTVIGAYQSVGKTAFSLNIAVKQAGPVVFFSLEMTADMIYERLAAVKLKTDYHLFNSQRLSEEQYREVEVFVDILKTQQFYVFDDVYHIEQQANVISSIKPHLVIVDYVQIARTHRKSEGRRMEIEYISAFYKQIAKSNNCAISLLSQLTRPDNHAKEIKPTMNSLKESGALAADGDVVAILHRPHVFKKDDPSIKPESGYILVDKNKFGATGKIDLHFSGKFQTFYEVNKEPKKKNDSGFKQIHYQGVSTVEADEDCPFL